MSIVVMSALQAFVRSTARLALSLQSIHVHHCDDRPPLSVPVIFQYGKPAALFAHIAALGDRLHTILNLARSRVASSRLNPWAVPMKLYGHLPIVSRQKSSGTTRLPLCIIDLKHH
jgi:hypothetical protein